MAASVCGPSVCGVLEDGRLREHSNGLRVEELDQARAVLGDGLEVRLRTWEARSGALVSSRAVLRGVQAGVWRQVWRQACGWRGARVRVRVLGLGC